MTFNTLAEIIFGKVTPKLENNRGVGIFAKERAKFEDWLKVEVCESLSGYTSNIIPEKNRIDIVFDEWAMELKTINTNYQVKKLNIKKITRPITQDRGKIIDDIKKLRNLTNYPNKAVLFVVFPTTHDNTKWQNHLQKIRENLKDLKHKEFKFKGEIPGVIYLGLV